MIVVVELAVVVDIAIADDVVIGFDTYPILVHRTSAALFVAVLEVEVMVMDYNIVDKVNDL